MPGDRQRFTLAHEFAHIVMHNMPTEKMEEEANRFASEFLMPSSDISYQLSDLTLEKLAYLKLYWKTSMQSLLEKARTLRKITERKYTSMWKEMSMRGYKLNEPIEFSIPPEKPQLINELIKIYMSEFRYNVSEMSSICNLDESEFNSYYFQNSNEMRLVK